ncbi:trypsin-like peptidase domain-containing protein [Streptomyces sp. NPDC059466]|uniref:trypsin-like peptidase domain-containing protein n=1 Tax=unclassified Streptomyces TaxID=2593676 RepID=UPI0036B5C5DF
MNEGKPPKAKWWNRPRPVPPVVGEVGSVEGVRVPEDDSGRDGGGFEHDGDFQLQRPAPAPTPAPTASAPGAGPIAGVSDTAPESPAPADRPTPVHERDPYSTPPYGEPGPWAPAPPVQHPTVTPAHATPAPTVTPAHATPALADDRAYEVPAPADDVAYGIPAPAGDVAYGIPAPAEGDAYGTAAAAERGAYGTAAPAGGPPDPAGGAPHGVSAPVAVSGAGTGVPAATPVPAASLPPGAPPAPYTSVSRPAPDPWQNYDPWAAPGPLQQNGAAVGTGARRGRARKGLVLGAVLVAVVAGGVGGALGAYLERNGAVGDIVLPQAAKEAPGRPADSVAGIAARALPGVVTLHVRGTDEAGTGTGFVLDDRGHILTNNHVVQPAGARGEITVTFSGGESAKATVVGHDSGYDLAVVEVSGVRGLRPLPLGNSDGVQVGDPVVAIGAPFDLANTVTSGIISAKERPITAGGEKGDGSDVSYVDALQTDAPINPGNSGGPLLDSRARVIGINSAIRSADSSTDPQAGQAGSIGLGFAIPVNQAKRVAEELINTGRATHPVIGVTLDMNYTGDGARVGTKTGGGSPVTPGGPGARAGIRAGDVITEVDGLRVHSGEELIVRTRAHRPGDRLLLTLRRGGAREKITLVLGSADGD